MRLSQASLMRVWNVILPLSFSCAALILPLQLVTASQNRFAVLYMDGILTLIFGLDIALRWRRHKHAAQQTGFAANQTADTSVYYSLSWFALDLLAALPLAMLFDNGWWQLLRLLKFTRVGQFMRQLRKRAVKRSNFLRLAFFIYWLLFLVHWIACGWLALRGVTPGKEASAYLHALYWTIQTFATVGYGDSPPQNETQIMYAIIAMLIGAGVYSYIIANVASLLANINPAKVRHLENLEKLTAFMHYRNIPPEMQKRIREYYDYLWDKRLSYDETTIISDLPPSLKTEVSLFLKREIIEKVPLFQDANEAFIKEIALQMQPLVFLPGDYVYHAGEPGRDMYFISKGAVEVVSRDGAQVYATLTEGDFFGEIALVLHEPRTAGVRALTFCDLYRLDKETFEHVLRHHPEIGAQITNKAKKRRARDKQDRASS